MSPVSPEEGGIPEGHFETVDEAVAWIKEEVGM